MVCREHNIFHSTIQIETPNIAQQENNYFIDSGHNIYK